MDQVGSLQYEVPEVMVPEVMVIKVMPSMASVV